MHESCNLLAMSTCLKIIQSITIFLLNEINQIKGKQKTKKSKQNLKTHESHEKHGHGELNNKLPRSMCKGKDS